MSLSNVEPSTKIFNKVVIQPVEPGGQESTFKLPGHLSFTKHDAIGGFAIWGTQGGRHVVVDQQETGGLPRAEAIGAVINLVERNGGKRQPDEPGLTR